MISMLTDYVLPHVIVLVEQTIGDCQNADIRRSWSAKLNDALLFGTVPLFIFLNRNAVFSYAVVETSWAVWRNAGLIGTVSSRRLSALA